MKDIRRIPSTTNSQLQEIHEPIGSLSIAIESLNDDLKRLDTEYIHSQNVLQTVIQRLPTLKQSIDDQNAFVDSLKPIQEIFEEDIRLATQKFNDTRLMSNDGLYIWKINNVQEKMSE
jgi:chromosome segregation ATPase